MKMPAQDHHPNFDEPYWFSPDPPTPEEQELHYRAFEITKQFDQASYGENVQECLSSALSMLTRHAVKRDGPALALGDKDRMLDAMQRAHQRAWLVLPPYCGRDELTYGMTAAAQIVVFWASSSARRAAGGSFIRDMHDAARILQNSMHSECLREQLRERMLDRARSRKRIFKELMDMAIPASSIPTDVSADHGKD
jgi:hypothetical protein